ncbi:MAG: hypothetical protein H6P96_1414 [Candidatus Aminicenantes bacterium]|nr:hypothetical protein [Candidatus Aminicenantes bacterium]
MPAEDAAVAVDDVAFARPAAEDVGQVAVVEVLAFLPVVDGETGFPGDRPDPALGQVSEREVDRGELRLAQTVEEVGLVLAGVGRSKTRPAARAASGRTPNLTS